ncbi:Mimitin, mitochondrial [Aix galericulata]|nr:Mimitin, mitochondrial [Aix galericulata]
MSWARQALRALRRRLFGPGKELAGTDQFGNKYYRVPEHESRAGRQGTAGQGACPRVQPPVRGVQSAAACLRRGAGQQRALLGQIIPERRFVEAINRQAYQYEMGDFPTEWEAWIRKKRKDPPTIEEILRNESYRQEMEQKVKDVYEKDKLLQAKEYKEGLVAEPVRTQVKGHASAPYFGKSEPSQDPASTANTFQPGSWIPPASGSNQPK